MNDDSGENRDDQTAETKGSSSAKADLGAPEVAKNAISEGPMANSQSGSAITSSINPIRRILWLDERVAEARQKTFGPSQPGWAEYDAARHARDGVVQIGETGLSSWAVLLLERVMASLLVRAHAARAGLIIGTGPLNEADWDCVRKVSVIQEAWNNLSAVQVAALVASLGNDGDKSTANLPLQQRKAFAIGLHNFVTTIAEPLEFEANRMGRALFARYTRVTIAAVALIVVISAVLNWIGSRFEKPNIALHRPVEVSSQYPGAGEDHTLLVDGDRTNLGFHTNCEGGFVIIDLGSVHKISKVVVYNRDEGQERAVPLSVEVSTDHQAYRPLAEKREVFDKWAATGLNGEGRYVRLRNKPPNCFHLAEVEIY